MKVDGDINANIFYSSKTNDNLYFREEIEAIGQLDKRFKYEFRRT